MIPNMSYAYAKKTDLANKIDLTEKGSLNGVCPLDGAGLVPSTFINPNVLEYLGTWDALINSPSLVDGVGGVGNIYIVSVAGTQFTPSIDFGISDFVIYDGTKWKRVASTSISQDPTFNTINVITKQTTYDNLSVYSQAQLNPLNKIDMLRFRCDFYGSRSYPSVNLWTNQPTHTILGISGAQVRAVSEINDALGQQMKKYDINSFLSTVSNAFIFVYPHTNSTYTNTLWCNIYRITSVYAVPDANGYIEYNVTPISVAHTYTASETLIVDIKIIANTSQIYDNTAGRTILTNTNLLTNLNTIDTQLSSITSQISNSGSETMKAQVLGYTYGGRAGTVTTSFNSYNSMTIRTSGGAGNTTMYCIRNVACPKPFTTKAVAHYFCFRLSGSSWGAVDLATLFWGAVNASYINNITTMMSVGNPTYSLTYSQPNCGACVQYGGFGNPSGAYLWSANTASATTRTGYLANSTVYPGEYLVMYINHVSNQFVFDWYYSNRTFKSSAVANLPIATDYDAFTTTECIPMFNSYSKGVGFEIDIVNQREMTALGFYPVSGGTNIFTD